MVFAKRVEYNAPLLQIHCQSVTTISVTYNSDTGEDTVNAEKFIIFIDDKDLTDL